MPAIALQGTQLANYAAPNVAYAQPTRDNAYLSGSESREYPSAAGAFAEWDALMASSLRDFLEYARRFSSVTSSNVFLAPAPSWEQDDEDQPEDNLASWKVIRADKKGRSVEIGRLDCSLAANQDLCTRAQVLTDMLGDSNDDGAYGLIVASAGVKIAGKNSISAAAVQAIVASATEKAERAQEYNQLIAPEGNTGVEYMRGAAGSKGARKMLSIMDGSCGPGDPCLDKNCCSEWGFCGATDYYCNDKCQPEYSAPDSACRRPPPPPSSPQNAPSPENVFPSPMVLPSPNAIRSPQSGSPSPVESSPAAPLLRSPAVFSSPFGTSSPSPATVGASPSPQASGNSPSPVGRSPARGSPSPRQGASPRQGGGYPVGPDGQCGSRGENVYGCVHGACCSRYGYCGYSDAYCGKGCQEEYSGDGSGCARYPVDEVNGRCGDVDGQKYGCAEGNCCSRFGYCGEGDDYCAVMCQPEYSGVNAQCNTRRPVDKVNHRCGHGTIFECDEDNCCSGYGFCGKGDLYCGIDSGCQEGYGRCD